MVWSDEDKQRQAGFTAVELMVTIAILAILLTIALPSFQGVIRSNRLATMQNEFTTAMALARTEAIRNARGTGICATSNGSTCATSWSGNGWMVWNDLNGNSAKDATETVIARTDAAALMSISETAPAGGVAALMAFDGRGRLRDSAERSIVFQPASCTSGPYKWTLTILPTGQIRTTKGNCS